MPKIKKSVVDDARPRESAYFVWDEAVAGFGVRIWPSGRKQYVYQYRDRRGSTHRETIGWHGEKTPEQARTKAEAYRVNRKDSQLAPHAVRLKEREAKGAANVNELATLFLDHITARRRRKAKPQTVREYRRLVKREIAPALGSMRIQDVTRRDVERVLAKVEKRPAIANNVHALLRAMFHFAELHDLREGRNPCAGWERHELPHRSRSLTPEQYSALGAALERAEREGLPVPPKLRHLTHGKSKAERAKATGRTRGAYKLEPERQPRLTPANPRAIAVLRFLALSGWREGEALSLRRDALDVRVQVARLADTKTGRSVRPLGKAALAVLQPFLDEPLHGNPYVFPGQDAGQHLKEIKRLWLAAKDAAGVSVRLHDLRHSFATTGRELNYIDAIIAGLVGHVLPGMTSRYGDVPEATLRLAADTISQTVANRLAGEGADVLTFAPRAASA